MPVPELLDSYIVEGPRIDLRPRQPGRVVLDGPLVLLPFEEVDCTTNCGGDGWRELHALLWDEEAGEACFGILYLFDDRDQVRLTYTLTLPSLSDPVGVLELEADWSYEP